MNIVVALLILLTLTSCISIGEPKVTDCTILDDKIAVCRALDNPDNEYDVSLVDLIGGHCASSEDYVKILNHHDALHTRIKELEKQQ